MAVDMKKWALVSLSLSFLPGLNLIPVTVAAAFWACEGVGRGAKRSAKEAKKYAAKPKTPRPAPSLPIPPQSTELAIRNVDDEIRALDEALARKLAYWESAENVGDRERRYEINQARQQHAQQIERLIN